MGSQDFAKAEKQVMAHMANFGNLDRILINNSDREDLEILKCIIYD